MRTDKNGFTFPELLLCLFLFSTLVLLTVSSYNSPDLSHLYFLNDYLLCQSEALTQRISCFCDKGITFNSMGHVNMGMTVRIGTHEVIVHLGNGYATLH